MCLLRKCDRPGKWKAGETASHKGCSVIFKSKCHVDANLMHDLTTGGSMTGTLHFVNKTPLEWFSKKQATSETAAHGSEFVAARTCGEQLIDMRTTFRCLGVPIIGHSHVFGDNESVVNSSMKRDSRLHKRHVALSFHRVRESIAARITRFFHIPGKINPADMLTKAVGWVLHSRGCRFLMGHLGFSPSS